MQLFLDSYSYMTPLPVKSNDKHPVEVEDDAEVGISPDPHREGKEHDPDDGDVGGAVQEHHHVHQGELLYLRKCIFLAAIL